jgi:hypothetical protein
MLALIAPTHLGNRDNIAVLNCVSTVSMQVSGFEFTRRTCHILPCCWNFFVPPDCNTRPSFGLILTTNCLEYYFTFLHFTSTNSLFGIISRSSVS